MKAYDSEMKSSVDLVVDGAFVLYLNTGNVVTEIAWMMSAFYNICLIDFRSILCNQGKSYRCIGTDKFNCLMRGLAVFH